MRYKDGKRTGTYRSWEHMKARCDNPNYPQARYYSELDISYDPTWAFFENFYADMGDRPEGMSLERLDSSKGYSKVNCKWATSVEQNRNRSVVKMSVERANELRRYAAVHSLAQSALATMFGVSRRTVGYILSNERWT